MVVLQLVGQGAFILASLILGAKLLLLWRRTRELPELTLGLSFFLGGGLGYVAWFVLAFVMLSGGTREVFHAVASAGLFFTIAGATANGIGVARIYRPATAWPVAAVCALGVVMAGIWTMYVVSVPPPGSPLFWTGILACTPIYVWGAVEAAVLARNLHRRAKLGLADPVVVNRIAMWGASGLTVVAMIATSLLSRLVHGPIGPPWVAAVNAALGMVAAATIWLGFFPPQALRARLARAYAS